MIGTPPPASARAVQTVPSRREPARTCPWSLLAWITYSEVPIVCCTPQLPLKGRKPFRGSFLPPCNSIQGDNRIFTNPKYSCNKLRAETSWDRPYPGCRKMHNEICHSAAAGSIAIKPFAEEVYLLDSLCDLHDGPFLVIPSRGQVVRPS